MNVYSFSVWHIFVFPSQFGAHPGHDLQHHPGARLFQHGDGHRVGDVLQRVPVNSEQAIAASERRKLEKLPSAQFPAQLLESFHSPGENSLILLHKKANRD